MTNRKDALNVPRMPRRGKAILLDARDSAAEYGWGDESVAAIHAARDAGWTLQEIGDVIGCTREYVRQLCNKDVDQLAEISGFPAKPPKKKPKQPIPVSVLRRQLVSDTEIAELADLAQLSKWRRRGGDDKYAAAAEEFWRRINHLVTLGVPAAWLSKRIGLAPGTIRMGLSRYGYAPIPPSQPQRLTGDDES